MYLQHFELAQSSKLHKLFKLSLSPICYSKRIRIPTINGICQTKAFQKNYSFGFFLFSLQLTRDLGKQNPVPFFPVLGVLAATAQLMYTRQKVVCLSFQQSCVPHHKSSIDLSQLKFKYLYSVSSRTNFQHFGSSSACQPFTKNFRSFYINFLLHKV